MNPTPRACDIVLQLMPAEMVSSVDGVHGGQIFIPVPIMLAKDESKASMGFVGLESSYVLSILEAACSGEELTTPMTSRLMKSYPPVTYTNGVPLTGVRSVSGWDSWVPSITADGFFLKKCPTALKPGHVRTPTILFSELLRALQSPAKPFAAYRPNQGPCLRYGGEFFYVDATLNTDGAMMKQLVQDVCSCRHSIAARQIETEMYLRIHEVQASLRNTDHVKTAEATCVARARMRV